MAYCSYAGTSLFHLFSPRPGGSLTRDGGSLSFYTQINQRFIQLSQLRPPGNQSHLYVGLDQGYIEQKEFEIIYEQANKTARIISGLITYLRTKPTK